MTQQQTFRCAACGGEFPTQEALRAHAQQYHAQGQQAKFHCAACGGDFDSQEALQAHARAAHAC